MASVVKCDACPTVMATEKMMYITFNAQSHSGDSRVWKHEVKGADSASGLDVCPACFNKIMEVLNVNKRLDG